ncbi:MAG: arylsulfatase [Sphingomonadales bacterium]|nr:arylsulfatase [Sphingomonadales bacterium]
MKRQAWQGIARSGLSHMAVIAAATVTVAGEAAAQQNIASPFAAEGAPAASAPAPAAPAAVAAGKPNVLIWMMDDVGFGQLSCYGGLVDTPNIDRVAGMGLRYTNYHTAPICSASRAAMLTGRNPHSVHIGGHATAAREGLPGHDGRIPAEDGTIAANLRQAGYTTFALGKWDHLPNEEASPAGPFTHWATGQGFDHFYGFLAADADQWNPVLWRDTQPTARPGDGAYHLSTDLADQAIAMIGARGAAGDAGRKRPFLLYWATGAAHAPHHAPADWIARYHGKFDIGWDKARAQVLKAQIARGLVPAGTRLAPRPEGMPAWDSLSADQKRLYARQMEVFAAALSYADAQFGRMLDALAASGELDNTLMVIASDNGASAEGGPDGLYNEAEVTSRKAPGVAENMAFYNDWGGPRTYPHYAMGWAVAGDTPYRYYKQTTHEGGTRVPLIVAWPRGIAARGGVRRGFVHVTDIAPTLLDAAAVPLAKTINDVPQAPMEGRSMAATFTVDADPRQGRDQYTELYGNKALWSQGWSIVTSHRLKTWEWNTARTFDEPWELYDTVADPGQTRDRAKEQPERVARMAKAFEEQAKRYNVYPVFNLSDTAAESMARMRGDFARRQGQWHYPGRIGEIPGTMAPPVAALGFRMTARLDLPTGDVTGPIFAQGGQMGGIGLYLDKGHPRLIMNDLGGGSVSVTSAEALAAGVTGLALSVERKPGADGSTDFSVTIRAGERVLAQQAVRFALPAYFGLSEVFGVGDDAGSPVLAGYHAGKPFPSTISDVTFAFSVPGKGG